MMKRLLILGCTALFAACGTDSTSSNGGSYPLQLQFISSPTVSGTIANFNLKVTHSGVAVQGARLTVTTYPKDTVITLKILSDASGAWTNIGVTMGGSVQQVAFQALKDTLKSNYVTYAP